MKKILSPKKIFIIIGLLLAITAGADFYHPDFYLPGIPQIDGNSIDYYHFDQGFSISPTHRSVLSKQGIRNELTLDYDEGKVQIDAKISDIELFLPVYISIDSYYHNIYRAVFRNKLAEKTAEILGDTERSEGGGLIPEIVIELPKVALPKSVRRFMGDKAGRLSLDGSQRLTVTGRNTAREQASLSEGDRANDFNFKLQQDLNLRLRGTIGEKIHVDVNHQQTSEDVIATPTEINVSYEGDEDEVIKSIEGGNIALSLSGSDYISYNFSSEGLFGIKSDMEVGNLKFTTILGKDEAKKDTQKWTGDSQPDSSTVVSNQFVNNTHYFLKDPHLMYELYTSADENIPAGWIENAIKLNDTGAWRLSNDGNEILPISEVTLYLDDGNANNDQTTIQGIEIGYSETIYNFDILLEGSDYMIDYESGIIILKQAIQNNFTIGITYTKDNGSDVGNNTSTPVEVELLRFSNQTVTDVPYWNKQIRNIYDMGTSNVKNEGFELNVYQKKPDGTPDYDLPDSLVMGNYTTFNEYLRLDQNDDGLINADDSSVDLDNGYIVFPFLRPFEPLGDPELYEERTIIYNECDNFMSVKGQIGRDQISLGQMNILPNSVEIKVGPNNEKLKENIDYIVDYDFGVINFLTEKAKDSDIEIDISYQYKPLFSVDSRTIMGIRADMEFSPQINVGGTFIYQSEKVNEDRPKIGNENRSIILADLDGEIDYEVPFITKIIDFLPLIKTDERSHFSLSGEVAMSMPRVYGSSKQHDKKEAYVDDMEAILDAFPLGVTRTSWSPASKPASLTGTGSINYGKAATIFYNPQNIYMRNVYNPETLTEEEEQERTTVLACKIKPNPISMPGVTTKSWGGIMKYVGNEIDISQKKYIEVLIKVDTLNNNLTQQKPVTMHIDLGDINENFYTYTDQNGEGILDFEDGIVTRDGKLDLGEDLGLDRIEDGSAGDDPNDNYSKDMITLNGEEEYPHINRTEGNNKLDSEDFDSNGSLNMVDVYYQYSLPLDEDNEFMLNDFQGWRLYRIPLRNQDNYNIVSNQPNAEPDFEDISYARVWFEVEDSTRIKIATLDIVGNKWEEDKIRDANGVIVQSEEETYDVGIIGNQKNQHYTPAPHTVIEELGEETLEQSLSIKYKNLGADHYGLVTQEFIEPYNMLSYRKLRFWTYSELEEASLRAQPDSLIIRMGADSTHYYEIRHELDHIEYQDQMLRDGWREIEIDFSDITHLNAIDSRNDVSYSKDNFHYRKVGNPTLTNIAEISLGMNASSEYSGTLYYDDIRVAEPYEDIGFAAKTTLVTTFADFANLNVSYDWHTQNFQSSAQRKNISQNKEAFQLNINSRYNLNKFFPAEWGLILPLNLTRNQSLEIPLYKNNGTSDILRNDLPEEEKERQINKNLTYRATLDYSQSKTPRSKILELITKNTSIYGSIEKRRSVSPIVADTTFAFELKHDYDLNIPIDKLGINLWKNYKFFFFPKIFDNQFRYTESQPKKWRWSSNNDTLQYWAPDATSDTTRTFYTDTDVRYDIFSDIAATYNIKTQRDMMLKNYYKNLNIGVEKNRDQKITLDYAPKYLESVFSFSANGSVNYNEDHVQSSIQDSLYYEGEVNRSINGSFTLKNQDLLSGLSDWFDRSSDQADDMPSEQGQIDKKDEPKKIQGEPEKERIEPAKDPVKPSSEDIKSEGKESPAESIRGKEPDKKDKNIEDGNGREREEIKNPIRPNENRTNPISAVIDYIARISNIKIDYNNSYRTTYDHRAERPEFLYQLGLPHILKEEGEDKEIELKSVTDKYSTSLNYPILNTLSTTWGYSYEIKRSYSNSSSEDITTVFPNVSVILTEFEKLIRLENILTSSRLSTSFILTNSESGDIGFTDPETKMVRMSLAPLLSWNGNWLHNITSNLSMSYTNTQNTRILETYDIITTAQTANASSHFSWSYANPKGIKLPFLRRTNMKNELTTDLDLSFERTINVTENTNMEEDPEPEINKIKYTIEPGASYDFNNSITSGLTAKYEWDKDLKSDNELKIMSLGIWVEILF